MTLWSRSSAPIGVLDAATFYPAEEYHRDYAKRNKLNYEVYRMGCGRDRRLAAVWGRG